MRIASPSAIVQELRDIADRIDRAEMPSRTAVAAAIEDVLASFSTEGYRDIVASDKSLALAIRDAIHGEIQKLVPGEVTSLYDTNPDGKGWKPGYVSFGLQPVSWQTEGIIGGILIRCTYDAAEFRSEKLDDGPKDFKHSKGGAALSVSLSASYYNKKAGGSVETQSTTADLGTATLAIEADESISEVDLDAGQVSSGVKSVMQDILSHPPDYAQSAKRKQKHVAPTGSPGSFVKWLLQNNRSDVGKSEVDALVRAMAERGTAAGTAREKVMDALRHARIPMNPNA